MYIKSLSLMILFALLLSSALLAEDPFSLKEDEKCIQIISFDGEMTYTATYVYLHKIEEDDMTTFAFPYFPARFPLNVTAKNINAYNVKTGEKLDWELIKNMEELINFEKRILSKWDYIPLGIETEAEFEINKRLYNLFESGEQVFMIDLSPDQFEDNKIEFVFQFDTNLEEYSLALEMGPIDVEHYYLFKNYCKVTRVGVKNVDRLTFLAPINDEIWRAKIYQKKWIFKTNKRSPDFKGYKDNRRHVSWDVSEMTEIYLEIGFGDPSERISWENQLSSAWSFSLVIIVSFLTANLAIVFSNYKKKRKLLYFSFILFLIFMTLNIIYLFYKTRYFPIPTNIVIDTMIITIVVVILSGTSSWYVLRKKHRK